jgi:Tfp pilus assembly protein PilX
MGFRNRRLRGETGIALPLVLMVLVVVTALAAVAAAGTIRANHQSLRDRNTKRSFQAAVAGIQSANDQTTLLQPDLDQCVVKDGSGNLTLAATSGGWCAAQSDDLGDNAGYTQYVSAGTRYTDATTGQELIRREIVSTGTVNGVTRRVDTIVNAATAAPLFPPRFAAVSLDPIDWGNQVRANGNVGSNGDITVRNQAVIDGDAITPGNVWTYNTAVVTGSRPHGTLHLDPVDQGTSPGASNSRLAFLSPRRASVGGTEDTCTQPVACSGISWNAGTRVLSLANDATLTLSGTSYSFCKITLRNRAKLIVAAGSTVKIFIDDPAHCSPGLTDAGSVILSNNSELVNGNSSPAAMQLYLVGSPSVPTTLDFANSITSEMVMSIYAPYSSVHLENDAQIRGALAAKSIPIDNDATITYDPLVGGISGGGIPVYRSSRSWIECTAKPTGAAVNSGCWN